jgi:hypothetical protein
MSIFDKEINNIISSQKLSIGKEILIFENDRICLLRDNMSLELLLFEIINKLLKILS